MSEPDFQQIGSFKDGWKRSARKGGGRRLKHKEAGKEENWGERMRNTFLRQLRVG